MLIQELITNTNDVVEKLFVNRNLAQVSYDTFYNGFFYNKFLEYTEVNKVSFKLIFTGKSSFRIICKNCNKEIILVSEKLESKNSKGTFVCDISLLNLPQNGMIYPVFNDFDSDFKIINFSYSCDTKAKTPFVAAIICTYKRDEFVYKNLERLTECKGLLNKVIVVDNGNTINANLNDDFVKVVPNLNLGGSGGFTRGMMEAKNMGATHMLLMDDDIVIVPETICRAIYFLSLLKDEYADMWLGYSMILNNKPTTQFELGSRWSGYKMMINNHNIPLTSVKSLFRNETHHKYNYSAWWSLFMPVSVIDKNGLPYPFFIKFDDIEYGIRSKNQKILLSNGFGVWHENFDDKYSPSLEYYLMRNAAITNALHFSNSSRLTAFRYFGKCVKSYLKFKFVRIKMINAGLEDYFKGPSFLIKLDQIENNAFVKAKSTIKPNPIISFLFYPIIIIKNVIKIWIINKKIAISYLNNFVNLTSEENWKKLLGL